MPCLIENCEQLFDIIIKTSWFPFISMQCTLNVVCVACSFYFRMPRRAVVAARSVTVLRWGSWMILMRLHVSHSLRLVHYVGIVNYMITMCVFSLWFSMKLILCGTSWVIVFFINFQGELDQTYLRLFHTVFLTCWQSFWNMSENCLICCSLYYLNKKQKVY